MITLLRYNSFLGKFIESETYKDYADFATKEHPKEHKRHYDTFIKNGHATFGNRLLIDFSNKKHMEYIHYNKVLSYLKSK